MGVFSWFNRQTPYTGTGSKPASSLPAKVTVKNVDNKGKKIPTVKKGKK